MEDHTDAENVKGLRQPGAAPASHSPPATTDDLPKPDLPEDVDISDPQYTGEDEERELEETSDRSPPSYYRSCLAWAVKYRILLEAGAKVVGLFLLVVLALALLLVTLLPPIDPQHKPDVKIPRSFDDLKRLNVVLQIYKQRNFGRVLGSFIAVYLFVPGSLYMSILAGAMYGVIFALPLVCLCIATGATLCYLISALLGPALLLASRKWRDRLDLWRDRIDRQGGNMISYLMILRIAPLPPHWMVNIICPHLNISIPMFWASTFLGVMAPSFIHVQIGTTLDQMTSPSEFHLLSWRNILGLSGVVIAVLLPVIIRNIWAKELAEAAEDVVEVSTEVPTEEGEPAGHVGVVEVVVHDGDGSRSKASRGDAHRTGSARIGDGWSRLPSSSRIQLPGDVEESNSTISKRWIFNPFRSRSSRAEGKLRI